MNPALVSQNVPSLVARKENSVSPVATKRKQTQEEIEAEKC